MRIRDDGYPYTEGYKDGYRQGIEDIAAELELLKFDITKGPFELAAQVRQLLKRKESK